MEATEVGMEATEVGTADMETGVVDGASRDGVWVSGLQLRPLRLDRPTTVGIMVTDPITVHITVDIVNG